LLLSINKLTAFEGRFFLRLFGLKRTVPQSFEVQTNLLAFFPNNPTVFNCNNSVFSEFINIEIANASVFLEIFLYFLHFIVYKLHFK